MNDAPPIVLVVDDDATSILTIAELLHPEFQVRFAGSATEALEIIPQLRPDLILLDVIMRDMDGYQLCTRLKKDLSTSGIPIIFITGLQEPEAESYGLELGAADYVTKPFNSNVVRARVRNQIELKIARDRLLALAATDDLTGLFNRRAFDVALEREYKRMARINAPLSLIMTDVDHFKAFNDCYGHIAGDECLRQIAKVFGHLMNRPADLTARYGGEEFVCVLPDTTLQGSVAIAESILTSVRALAVPHSGSLIASIVTVSLGVASETCVQNGTGERLLQNVDAAMYRAKSAGRNRIDTGQ